MTFLRSLPTRLAAAILVASGTVILTSGLLAVVNPAAGIVPLVTATATPEASATPDASSTASASPTTTPGASPVVAFASRVVVPALGIDLPVVDQYVGPGHGSYPLCDVAQYLEQFVQPAVDGATFIYAHAQNGMFWPLLREWRKGGAKALLGDLVQVYTQDDKVYLYEVFEALTSFTFDLATSIPPGERWVILQTSTSWTATPRLMVAARLLNVADATNAEANPTPHWRDCRP
ncbi:MAG: sortase domain-bontaining protein [Candidatus Limnocylindrales bacterium]